MDPFSQAVLGAALPQSIMRPKQPDENGGQRSGSLSFPGTAAQLAVVAALAGMAPDLDVLIRSSNDPLLFLEYHRQFTHSLVFIPFGAALCALAFWPFVRHAVPWRIVWIVAMLGYGTHALLDACTTYGTMLLWPFSNARIAWNTVSVIDPLFTVPLFIAVLTATWRRSRVPARLGLAWVLCYLTLGWVQQQRAEHAGEALAFTRGHIGAEVSAKPSFGNLLLWKSIYEYEGRYWVDGVRAGWHVTALVGDSAARLNVSEHLPWLRPNSQQARDLARFRWFSNDHLAIDRERPHFVVDMRYSLLPNEIKGLWGIQLDPNAPDRAHVSYEVRRDASPERIDQMWAMLLNRPGVGLTPLRSPVTAVPPSGEGAPSFGR